MTKQQVDAAELEKTQYCDPHRATPTTNWVKTGRIASQNLSIKHQNTEQKIQIVVVFTESIHHEIQESWCQNI